MIDATRLGAAGGILWALSMFLLTIFSVLTGYASGWLELMEGIYPGYTISWIGCIVGAIYGFVDGFVGLFLLGWLYNKIK